MATPADALHIHSQIEEEIFYPAFRDAAGTQKADALVRESLEEHHLVDGLSCAERPRVASRG